MCGHPSFGWEVVQTLRRRITEAEEKAREEGKKAPPFTRLGEIAGLAVEVIRETVRRRVNDKLKLLYGFDADDLIRGSFEVDGKSVGIKQEAVKKHALSILDGSNKAQIIKDIHQNKGVLMGWDREDGLLHYHINAENFVLSLISGRDEAVGTGKYASGLSFADFFGNQTLARRREGFGWAEGTFQLILSGVMASRFFHEVGGDLHMVTIDGRGKNHAERVRFIEEDRMRLAVEAVEAARAGLVSEKTACDVIEAVVYGSTALDGAEALLFRAASRPRALEWLLRGYKSQDLPDEDRRGARRAPAKKR
jgi:hypothetical protein